MEMVPESPYAGNVYLSAFRQPKELYPNSSLDKEYCDGTEISLNRWLRSGLAHDWQTDND